MSTSLDRAADALRRRNIDVSAADVVRRCCKLNSNKDSISHVSSELRDAGFRVGTLYDLQCSLESLGFKITHDWKGYFVTRTWVSVI